MNNIKKLTTKGQIIIDLGCRAGGVLIWLVLLLLGGLTEVFFFVLIAYHIIGGLLNKDLASSTASAILLAPIHVGGKIALYIQHIVVEEYIKSLTAEELVNINHAIIDTLNRHPNQGNKTMCPVMYGCSTYKELREFNEDRITGEYNARKKQTSEKPKNTNTQPNQKSVNKTANTQTQSVDNLGTLSDAEKQKLQQMGKLEPIEIAYGKANAGDSQAMMFMGMSYNLDLKNPRKAFYWMDKATKKGNDQAEYFLGTYYADGYGIEKNEKNRMKGIIMILSSASKGNKDAIDCCMNKMEMSIEEMRNCGIPV